MSTREGSPQACKGMKTGGIKAAFLFPETSNVSFQGQISNLTGETCQRVSRKGKYPVSKHQISWQDISNMLTGY